MSAGGRAGGGRGGGRGARARASGAPAHLLPKLALALGELGELGELVHAPRVLLSLGCILAAESLRVSPETTERRVSQRVDPSRSFH